MTALREDPATAAPPRPVWWAATLEGVGPATVAVLCFFTASRLPFLHEAYWAPIAAVVVLYPGVEATQKAGADRFAGTAIGSLVGGACAAWWHGNLLGYGLAVFVAVGLCQVLRLESASRLCAVTVSVITLIPRSLPPHVVALHRFVEVCYGVACALAFRAAVDFVRRRWPK